MKDNENQKNSKEKKAPENENSHIVKIPQK